MTQDAADRADVAVTAHLPSVGERDLQTSIEQHLRHPNQRKTHDCTPPLAAGSCSSVVGSPGSPPQQSSWSCATAITAARLAPPELGAAAGGAGTATGPGTLTTGAGGPCRSSENSSGLFSRGFTVERMTITLLSTSNQNGAPRVAANAVSNHPSTRLNRSLPPSGQLVSLQPTGSSSSLSTSCARSLVGAPGLATIV